MQHMHDAHAILTILFALIKQNINFARFSLLCAQRKQEKLMVLLT